MKHHKLLSFFLLGAFLLVFTGCMTPEELRAYKIKTVNDFMASQTPVRVLPVASPEMNFASFGSAYLMLSARQHLINLKIALDNQELYQAYVNAINTFKTTENLSDQDATAKAFQAMTANDASLPDAEKVATRLTMTSEALKQVNPQLVYEEYRQLAAPFRFSFSSSQTYQDFDQILYEFAKTAKKDCHEIKEIVDSIRYNNDFLPPHLRREKNRYLAKLRQDPNEVTSTILPPNNNLQFIQQQIIEQSYKLMDIARSFSRAHHIPQPPHDKHDKREIPGRPTPPGPPPHEMSAPLPPRIREELVAFYFLNYQVEMFVKAADCMVKLHELKVEEEQLRAMPQPTTTTVTP